MDSGADDWAILRVEDNLGYLGSFGTGEATSALVGIEMTTSGYRADMYGGQWQTDGYVERVAADYSSWIIHLSGINTSQGHSGAPIYDDEYISWGIFGFGGGMYDGGGRAIDTWLFGMLRDAREESLERWGY
jgi:V8-like Glu-specific endopeptidase